MRRAALLGLLLTLLAAPAAAQDQARTLADIRQELSVLAVEIGQLRRELSTTGAPSGAGAAGSTLERVDLIEAALRDLTARTEELQFRVDRIVTDGTLRLGDIEFRLCEIEPGCDVGSLGETPTLGRGEAPPPPRPAPKPPAGGAELAVGEQADFDRAKAALDSGSFRSAADLFAAFAETYPGGPLTAQANFHRGEALAGLGETAPAARAFLTAFSSDPAGPQAPAALLKLGQSLGTLGQLPEACVTLGEVGTRFPENAAAAEAQAARAALGCG
jgi:tol-pal system protein YbgF